MPAALGWSGQPLKELIGQAGHGGYLGNNSGQGARQANRHSRTTAFRGNGSNAAVQIRIPEPPNQPRLGMTCAVVCGAPWV
jgi:hypothetical protein